MQMGRSWWGPSFLSQHRKRAVVPLMFSFNRPPPTHLKPDKLVWTQCHWAEDIPRKKGVCFRLGCSLMIEQLISNVASADRETSVHFAKAPPRARTQSPQFISPHFPINRVFLTLRLGCALRDQLIKVHIMAFCSISYDQRDDKQESVCHMIFIESSNHK